MTTTISATGNSLVGWTITVNDPNDTADPDIIYSLQITRIDTSGHYPETPVRAADNIDITGDPMTVIDYEAPLNTTFYYKLYVLRFGVDFGHNFTSSSYSTTVPAGFTLIINPTTPATRVAGTMMELDNWSYRGRILGKHDVLGRSNPVVASDILSGREGEFNLHTLNSFSVNYDGLGPYTQYSVVNTYWDSIFASGETLYLRNDWSYSGFDDMYFKTDGLKISRITGYVGATTSPIRLFNVQYVEVDMPATDVSGAPLFTWQTLADSNADWAEVASQYADWNAVLEDPTV